MTININLQRPVLSTIIGGLPQFMCKAGSTKNGMVKMQCSKKTSLDMEGISCRQDTIKFILAGSSAIQIGTHSSIDPTISVKAVVGSITEYQNKNNISSVRELVKL